MSLLSKIKTQARELYPTLVQQRRHLHMNPELSFQEYNTALFVEEKLNRIGIAEMERKADTGVIAVIRGRNPEKQCIALRADMDALPIKETNDVPYKSQNEGVMHACGHDVHTSSLLGAAQILHSLKDEFEGTIKLVFQPGEEKIPGGASLLIKEGVLSQPEVKQITGQHVMPHIPAGKVGFCPGIYMASADELYITVTGKGGHGAQPQQNIDPILIASHIIVALQQIVSRNAHPTTPTVLSFGKVIANGATNVIPDQVYIEGTFRTLDEQWRSKAHGLMVKLATGIAESMGGQCEFKVMRGFPFLKNDEALTAYNRAAAEEYLGKDNVLDLGIWMASEDFAYYSHEVPACFYRLGTGNAERGITSSVHTSTFDIEETALETGAGLLAWMAVKQLNGR